MKQKIWHNNNKISAGYNLVPELFEDQEKSAGIQHLKNTANKIYLE